MFDLGGAHEVGVKIEVPFPARISKRRGSLSDVKWSAIGDREARETAELGDSIPARGESELGGQILIAMWRF